MKHITEEFNFFFGIRTTIIDSIGVPVKQFQEHLNGNYYFHASYTHKKTEIELIVRNLKTKRTEGIDGISTKLLQATIHEITTQLEHNPKSIYCHGNCS